MAQALESEQPYRHTQYAGPLLWVPVLGAAIILLVIWVLNGEWMPLVMGLVLLLVYLFMFSLTVTVDCCRIRVKFGVGLVRFKYRLKEIQSVKTVRNKPWYGWGIRWYPGGLLLNVYGLDAVELAMRDGGIRRIGTNRPKELAAVIARHLENC